MKRYIIGLSGGMGAGKSHTARYLAQKLRAKLLSADDIYAKLCVPGQPCYEAIQQIFGPQAVTATGINRTYLGRLVFSDADARARLNELTHPAVREGIVKRLPARGFVVMEAPLMYTGGLDELCDTVWWIDAPYPVRLQRVIGRSRKRGRPLSKLQAQMRLDAQSEELALCRAAAIQGRALLLSHRQWPPRRQALDELISQLPPDESFD